MKLRSAPSTKEIIPELSPAHFPIVGIGASAGGLEALEQFLGSVPENSGMAYVVVQHLDPTQKGMLPELLQRISKMEVFLVTDRLKVKPNCVYVIPPNKSMSILKGALHLFDPVEARGLRLPIDFLLRSLAVDCKELAVGVILSGMGSDGCIGMQAIKENNGITMVQDPETAKFDSMPRSAIESLLVDIVAPPNELPTRLLEFIQHIPNVKLGVEPDNKDKSALEKVIILLRSQTGNDFSQYKKNTLYRRIERRMAIHKIEKIASYVHFLQENPKEVDILFKELMIGVTNFFRDVHVWERLSETVVPAIIANQPSETVFRAWIPGCSTGEEAYSLAIVFKEALEKVNIYGGVSLQIFATDLDNDAIETARRGIFPANIAADVSDTRLNRFFIKTEDGYRINNEIREMIVFAQHNIIMHPPFTKIDLLSCRNLLIYMDPELQKKLMGLFFYSLKPDGILLLGGSETLGMQSHLFTAVDTKLKIFKKAASINNPEQYDFPSSFSRNRTPINEYQMPTKPIMNIQALADQLLLHHFSPAGVLVKESGDIIYISGRTGKYLEPAVGKANLNIFAMLREGLRNEFPVAFSKVLMKKVPVVLHNIHVGTNGGSVVVNVHIQWIDKPEPLRGNVMVVFSEVPESAAIKLHPRKGKKTLSTIRETELEDEVQRLREEMQNITEEMQTSQEELKSTNEELQSTNEELQSTNEELTTSKEEMQSLNEELQTVNAELQSKVDEFSRVNNDMKNLLNSTDIATLFLDKELNIRRFTNQATKIFKLIKSDIGRPFTDQVSDLLYPGLAEDALEVLRTLVFIQKQIPTIDGRWFSIRIMPYRTFDDQIDGLVITFINISDLKQVDEKFREIHQLYKLVSQKSSDIIIQLTPDGKVFEFNEAAGTFFGRKPEEVINLNFTEVFVPEQLRKKTESEIHKLTKAGEGSLSIQVMAAGELLQVIDCSLHVMRNDRNTPVKIVLIARK